MSTTTPTLQLPYAEHGAAGGTPVVFLHGYSDSHPCFAYLMAELPDSIHACAVTQRGHGDAPKPEYGYDAAQMARDVVDFLDQRGIERAVVCGHSMGSVVATRVALDAPDRVAGLVLMGSRPSFAGLDELFDEIAAMDDAVGYAFAEAFQVSTLARPIPDGMLEAVSAESCKMPVRVWKAIAAGLLQIDHTAELAAIAAPTLVLWGDHDEFCGRAQQDALVAGIPNARFIAYEGGGHAFHWEDPATVARDIAAFAEEVA